MARTDQESVGDVSCPRTEEPSSSLAPNPSQSTSPDAAAGAETTDGDLLEKGQEHPDKISPDRYSPLRFALPSAKTPLLPLQGKRRGPGYNRVTAMSPRAHSASGMHLAGGTAQLEHGQVSGSMGKRFPVGFLLPLVSGRGGNILQPRSAPASLCPAAAAFQHQDVLLRRAHISTVTASSASHSPLFTPSILPPLPSSTASSKARGQILKPDTVPISSPPSKSPLWAQTPRPPTPGTISPSGAIWRLSPLR